MPGMGALGDEFTEPYLHIWKLEGGQTRSIPGVTLDLHPFCGIIGVQRAEHGEFRTRAPGNSGATWMSGTWAPGPASGCRSSVPGAGLCAGDAHAAQGDGEVSINGMEAPMTVTFRLHLHKGTRWTGPYAVHPGPPARRAT
jgi:acetamidase/formamidase